jgi:cobalt-zinc-cadmium efflux system outer membrane protein
VLENLPTLEQMAEHAYRLGKGSLLDLLDANRSRTEIRLNHLDLLQAETEAELDLLKASGLLLSTMEE